MRQVVVGSREAAGRVGPVAVAAQDGLAGVQLPAQRVFVRQLVEVIEGGRDVLQAHGVHPCGPGRDVVHDGVALVVGRGDDPPVRREVPHEVRG